MGACFRLRGGRRRAKPPATLAGDGDFVPAIFCAAKAAHRKVTARLPCTKAAQRKGGEQRTLSTGTLCAKESHRKTQARWMAHRKGYGKASLHKGGVKKGGLEQRTLSTGTLCAKESHRKTQARWMAHRKGYGKASLRKSGAQKRLSSTTLFTGTSCAKESHRKAQARWMAHRKGYGKASLRKGGAKKGGLSNVRCLSALRAQKVSINVRAMHERHLHKAAFSRRGGIKVYITKYRFLYAHGAHLRAPLRKVLLSLFRKYRIAIFRSSKSRRQDRRL